MMSVVIAVAVEKRSNLALQRVAKHFGLGWNSRISKDGQSLFTGVDGPKGGIQKKKPRSQCFSTPMT